MIKRSQLIQAAFCGLVAATPVCAGAASLTFLEQPEGLTDGLLEQSRVTTGLVVTSTGAEPVRLTLDQLSERIEVTEEGDAVQIDFELSQSESNPNSPGSVPTDIIGGEIFSDDSRDFTFSIDEPYDYTFESTVGVSDFATVTTQFFTGPLPRDPFSPRIFLNGASVANQDGIVDLGDDASVVSVQETSDFDSAVSGTLPAGIYSITLDYSNSADDPGSASLSAAYRFTASPANQIQSPAAVPTPSAAVAGLVGLGFAMRRRSVG